MNLNQESSKWFGMLFGKWRFSTTILSLILHLVILTALIFLLPSVASKSAPGERSTGEVGLVYGEVTQPVTQPVQQTADTPPQADTSAVPAVEQILAEQRKMFEPQADVLPDVAPLIGAAVQETQTSAGNGNPLTGAAGNNGSTGDKFHVTGSFMGAHGSGSRFIYVLDRSASTSLGGANSPLVIAKRELAASLAGLLELGKKEGKLIHFQIIFFNHEATIYRPQKQTGGLPFLDETTLESARRFVGGIVSAGGTQAEPALLLALEQRGDVIFFLTDGATNLTPGELANIRHKSHGEQIHVVEYGKGKKTSGFNSLQQLARENHGEYVYVRLP
ncbi:MAG: hypothetical protein LBQ54_13235 [Planctomycetaceae bacterium]|jgi:hypothetical protein|nr:hypothetical protein [Planctomycetaceae bacterium]